MTARGSFRFQFQFIPLHNRSCAALSLSYVERQRMTRVSKHRGAVEYISIARDATGARAR